MFRYITLFALGMSAVQAHMQLYSPAPLRAFNNPHTQGTPDTELDFPYNCCGKTTPMPCRGYLSLLGKPEGQAVASWPAGSEQTWSMIGPQPYGGNHYGGSCQIGFSTDKGQTFRTVVSYEGNCPHRTGGMDPAGQQFPFIVPSDLPSGEQIFAWTWNNREQEFFMNCAVVNITGGPDTSEIASAPKSNPNPSILTTSASVPRPSSNPYAAGYPPGSAMYQAEDDSTNVQEADTNDTEDCDEDTDSEVTSYGPTLDVTMKFKRVPGDRSQRYVQRSANVAFSTRPSMLFAVTSNGCTSPKTSAELKYPNPGPEVIEGDGAYPVKLPSGDCA